MALTPEPQLDAEPGAPFEYPGTRGAVLCLHGLTATPYALRPIGDALAEAGYHVLAPLMQGHGTRPIDLSHTRWFDWLASARRGFHRLAEQHERVAIVGLSMGALCALRLAYEEGDRVAGVAAMGVPLELDWLTQSAFRLVRKVPFADALPPVPKSGGPDVSDAAAAAAMPGYRRVPLLATASLLDGQRAVLDCVGRIGVPVLVQHGRHDHTAPVRNARRLMGLLETPNRRLVIYPRSWHILPLDVEHEAVAADTVGFVNDLFAQGPTR